MAVRCSRQFVKNKQVIRKNNLLTGNGLYHCEYCGKKDLQTFDSTVHNFITIDHFIPLSKGGKHGQYNLFLVCKECNDIKANLHPVDLFGTDDYVEFTNKWRNERSSQRIR
jgi:5-methylcytosine-specific restriction endonuclease McrA